MTILTSDERSLICLALDEFASGFATALSDEDHDRARDLAERLCRSIVQAEDTH